MAKKTTKLWSLREQRLAMGRIAHLNTRLSAADGEVKQLTSDHHNLRNRIGELSNEIINYKEHIKQLEEQVASLKQAGRGHEDLLNRLFHTKEEAKACRQAMDKTEAVAGRQLDIIERLTKLLTKEVN
jgi:hypothetical protein